MIELRKGPRVNITWRAVVRLPDGSLMQTRAANLSAGGILLLCKTDLSVGQAYSMMLEVPGLTPNAKLNHIPCQGQVLHSILSGSEYRIGVKLVELSDLHNELIRAWVSRVDAA
jgi:hypothetical protein